MTNKILFHIMVVLAIVLLVLVAVLILGNNEPSVSLEENSREKGMCVIIESEETYCINGYLYKKNSNFNIVGKSTWGLTEVDDRPYIPLNGICECPKFNPLDSKIAKELTITKEALKKCEADLNITTQLAVYDVSILQEQIEETKQLCNKAEEKNNEEVKLEPTKEVKNVKKQKETRDKR